MSTKAENILDPNSCWNRAENDEPVFVLRANDDVAPANIILWAQQYMSSKGGYYRMTPAQVAKYNDAMNTAQAMKEWRAAKLKERLGGDDDIPF